MNAAIFFLGIFGCICAGFGLLNMLIGGVHEDWVKLNRTITIIGFVLLAIEIIILLNCNCRC